jgi:hypothetical protein
MIGVIGLLLGYRGSNRLLDYWSHNPVFNICLAGEYYPETHSLKNQATIENLKKDKKHILEMKYFDDELDLNHLLNHCDAIYFNTIEYPEPSGIALKALTLGKMVIIEEADSYLNDLSIECKQILTSKIISANPFKINKSIAETTPNANINVINDRLITLNSYQNFWMKFL